MTAMENEFEWLADLSKWQCFTTCELSHPAKSLDFGSDGFTASLTDWHELLQLTRPDATCGVVSLRGRFPDKAASILSRAQRRDDSGSKGTFGTNLLPPDPAFPDVELGERKAQGWVNFRWPYTQYELLRRDRVTGDIIDTGSFEAISFVSRGTLFQINRLKWSHGSSLNEYDHYASTYGKKDDDARDVATARFRVGGYVRFACPCSSKDGIPEPDAFTVETRGSLLCCTSAKYQTRVEVGLTENGVPQRLTPRQISDGSSEQQWIDLSSEHRVQIPAGEAAYLVSTYALRNDAEDDGRECSAELPDVLLDYLGVSRDSVNMTDRLWTALCATNYEAVEAVEFCIVGRCVEQVLGVTSIPAWQPPLSNHSQEGREQPSRMPERALIANIMNFQYVDVQSAFYQIRLLAKIHSFIETRKFERDFLQQFRSLDDIRDAYLVRLREAIRSTLAWLFATDLKPGRLLLAVHSEPTETNAHGEPANSANAARMEKCIPSREALNSRDTSYNRGCYATMAAWYATKMCPEAITPQLVDEILFPKLPVAYQLGVDRANRDKQPTSKSNVLQWLHFSCILLLCDELGWDENAHRRQPPQPHSSREDETYPEMRLPDVEETQQRFEKQVSRLKTSQADGWGMEHEELDRVLMLAEEMGLDRLQSMGNKSYSLAVSRARQTRRRIIDRKRTTKFNTGPTKNWMTARELSNGPWELLCTNHEAYLRVTDEANVIPARDRLFEFLLSDYSFMASWDRADANMVGRWWDMQPVAMICGTLLDLKIEGQSLNTSP
ncbi:hypothetical protein B0T26DRAFT_227793 [Lasiosphaeria miniovina]|uniref:Uncharacterized protein n=1 Tax=Lasiosphaeria miniovina TaxID=1954250 RepID=A0AA40E2I9_9PEZI|nr:uncharacterized protein B0T26DRAFT_227793 [Lasiosphaeria miniovina]KAK0722602.1 hypothetical protein B0T26DRAFT_227793 [Lasiosphaeria miniovina]